MKKLIDSVRWFIGVWFIGSGETLGKIIASLLPEPSRNSSKTKLAVTYILLLPLCLFCHFGLWITGPQTTNSRRQDFLERIF